MAVDPNGNAWWNWLISGLQIVAGIVLVATGVEAGLGASLIVGGIIGGQVYKGVQAISASKAAASVNLAPQEKTAVIGKMKDLNNYKLKAGEFKVADLLDDMGTPKANWKQNSGVLRAIMRNGNPIKDVSVNAAGELINNTGFLRAERYLLQSRGWTFINGFWIK